MKLEKNPATGHEVFNLAASVPSAALKWGDRVALHHVEGNTAVTYKEVDDMSSRLGNGLKALGVEAENRVAVLLDDCPEWAYILLGTLKIGAVLTPLNTLLTEKDYVFFLADSRAKVLFTGTALWDKIKDLIDALPALKRVVVCGGAAVTEEKGRLTTWDAFMRDTCGKLEVAPTFSNDVALFAYTSGSTGRPRAIMHTHRNIHIGASYFKEVYHVEEGHIQFHIPKLFFLTSLSGLISAFEHGSSMVLLSGRPAPETVLEVIAKYRPTFLDGPPTILGRMVIAAENAPQLGDMRSVRYIFCSGEALSPELFNRFQETFGKTLYNNWGAQELAAAPLSWQFGEEVPAGKIGSAGKSPCMGVIVKIVDEHGKEVGDGLTGEIMLKAKSQFISYWHEPEDAAVKIFEGWYKPGDTFMRDADGYYWYRGRLDDMVKVGGRPVFPVEVEHTVAGHPAVLEAAVIPVKNDLGLVEIHAFAVLKQGHPPSAELAVQIQNHVKSVLAPYKRPHRVEFVSELPRTATGKIQRFRLRDLLKGKPTNREQGGGK
ncbi:MAG: AMP-binding protein [Desulfobacterales bacterium]|nr:AMP-binding protein [Desulfobacterales bacterium]